MNPTNEQELREQLAAIEHERWADWQKYCHRVLRDNNPSPEQGDILERWDRQIETPYADLTELEKQSDREQVDRYWHLVQAHTNAEIAKAVKEAKPFPVGGSEFADGYMAGIKQYETKLMKFIERAKLKEEK